VVGDPLVSVIVPVLQERAAIGPTLDHLLALPGRFEVIVVDGGSTDGTLEIAGAHAMGADLVTARPGRGHQMNAGARVARGRILVFLHADTRLPMTAYGSLVRAVRRGAVGGNFDVRFDGGGAFAALLGMVYRLQRVVKVFYGDSVIWATRPAFARLGGYPEIPIMEDLELARALLATGRAARLPGPAITSSRRWRETGIGRTVLIWLMLRYLYVIGISPERLARGYRVVR
jgi:rSAM/selenodomain-associated transferase 2